MPNDFPTFLRLFTMLFMLVALTGACGIGVLFFFKKSGHKTANQIYGTLLLVGGGMQLHFFMAFAGWLETFASMKFLPIYFSLSLPVLFFYYVKLTLYPKYQARGSDIKHFTLPMGQLLYMFAIWLIPAIRVPSGRYFYNPFYGALEQGLFLVMFPMYIYFAYRYFRIRRKQLKKRSLPRLLWYVHKLIKGTMLFVLAYAILGFSDFLAHKFLHLNLRDHSWFAALAAGSFSSLLIFFAVYGFQVLLWGRRLLKQSI